MHELSETASTARMCFVDWICRVMSELPPEAILKLAWHNPHKTSLSLFVVFKKGYLTRRFGVNRHLTFGFFDIFFKANSKQRTQNKLQCLYSKQKNWHLVKKIWVRSSEAASVRRLWVFSPQKFKTLAVKKFAGNQRHSTDQMGDIKQELVDILTDNENKTVYGTNLLCHPIFVYLILPWNPVSHGWSSVQACLHRQCWEFSVIQRPHNYRILENCCPHQSVQFALMKNVSSLLSFLASSVFVACRDR